MDTTQDTHHGIHASYPDAYALVETMPEHHRQNHRNARNWGTYPHNGAERQWMDVEDAEQVVADDPDGYAHIVKTAPTYRAAGVGDCRLTCLEHAELDDDGLRDEALAEAERAGLDIDPDDIEIGQWHD